jgi:hypothetical protein
MARRFVSEFVLPLLKGGRLHVGRPMGWPALARILRTHAADGVPGQEETRAVAEVARLRRVCVAGLVRGCQPPSLDESSLRLAAAAHNLLLLGHAQIAGRPRDQERVAELAQELAHLGPPADLGQAVARYSLLARLPEVVWVEHEVRVGPSWLRFELRAAGGLPSVAMRALARVSATPVTSRRRGWWREIGFPTCADRAVAELFRACPLLEAMEPLCLHPPLSWRRILPVLRFPALGRVVAGRVLELGIDNAGSVLVMALLRFGSAGETDAAPGSAEEIAFAIRFLAHVHWLHLLFGVDSQPAAGSDFAALLAAAADVEPRLLWPPDIVRDSGLGLQFTQTLQRLRAETPACVPDRYRALRALCVLAATSGGGEG